MTVRTEHAAQAAPGDAMLRDLMSLTALPAAWAGQDAQTVLQMATDAMRTMVPVDAVFAQLRLPPERERICVLGIAGQPLLRAIPAPWEPFAGACEALTEDAGMRAASPAGDLTVLRFALGTACQGESICFACAAPDFPSPRQLAILRAGVSLCAAGLDTARIDFARARASRGKDEFLAMLGHELRNPLAPIVTTLEIIRRKGVGELGREIGMIDRQVRHMARLVDDLLDVTRITRDKVELRRDLIDVHSPVTAALEGVSPLMTERRHKIAYTPAKSEIKVDADPERLRQIFANLLANAGKFTLPGGNIGICINERPDAVAVSVTDDGVGIAPELAPHIFDLFEQGPTTIDRSSGGLGIGLAIVNKLVHLHGGSVSAISGGRGQGSTFEVVLPKAVAERREAKAQPHADQPPGTGKRVLVVDDNTDALETITTLLQLHGFEVAPAQTPGQAIEMIPAFSPQACVLDIGLPEMDGYKLASELKRVGGPALHASRFIALTGYGQADDKARAKAAGFHQHLVKPVLIENLLAALAEAPEATTVHAPEAANNMSVGATQSSAGPLPSGTAPPRGAASNVSVGAIHSSTRMLPSRT